MRLSVTLIFIFLTAVVSAQFSSQRYYAIYGGPGLLTVFSDIGDFNMGFAVNGGLRYMFDPHFSFKVNLVSGNIYGSDEGSRNESRGISFNTLILESTGLVEFFFFREKRGFSRTGDLILRPIINPYIFAGPGGIYFNPSVKYKVEADNPEYERFAMVFTGGGGLNIVLNRRWSMNIEMGGRYITTDYIDGYSSFASKSNDLYYFTTTNIIYCVISGPKRPRRYR
jgi:hypothetical protein